MATLSTTYSTKVFEDDRYSSIHGISISHDLCTPHVATSSATALEMHNVQILKMFVQREFPRSVQVMQKLVCVLQKSYVV